MPNTPINLTSFEGTELVIDTLVELFKNELAEVVTAVSNQYSDGINLEEPVQIVPYIPIASILEGGQPIFGIGELPTKYEDDLQHEMRSLTNLAVMIITTNSDHNILNKMLRRYRRAVQITIQRDREKPNFGEIPLLKSKAGVWYTKFVNTEPGPLFGEATPESLGQPPTSYTSWTGIQLQFTREEI